MNRYPFAFVLAGGISLSLGCGVSVAEKPQEKGGATPAKEAAATPAKGKAKGPMATPATVAEAVKVLDLRELSKLLEQPAADGKAKKDYIPRYCICSVSSQVPGDPNKVLTQVKEFFKKQKCVEAEGGYSGEEGGSATFSKGDYRYSVAVFSTGGVGKDSMASVTAFNHGNVDPQSITPPAKSTSLYNTPVSCAYLTESSVEDATAAAMKQFIDAGWEPYGQAGDTYSFRKNAVKLTVRVSSAPAQGNKTVVDYSTLLMSTEFPLMPEAIPDSVRYSDSPAQMGFDSKKSQEEVAAYYRETLAKQGWEATTKDFVKIDWKNLVIFRNKAKDLMEIELTTVDDITRSMVRFQTAAEVDAIDKAIKAEIARKKAESEKPLPKQVITLPGEASDVELSATRIEFQVAIGSAQETVAALKKQLLDAGWKLEDEMLENLFGSVTLKKEKLELQIQYTETGVVPSEITLSGRGVELEQAEAK